MSKTYPVIPAAAQRTHVDQQRYEDMYRKSIENNAGFWSEQARRISWIMPFSKVREVSFDRDDLHIRWFEDGTLNACYNCVDRHLESRADQTAIIWEGDDPDVDLHISYREYISVYAGWPTYSKRLALHVGTVLRSTCR